LSLDTGPIHGFPRLPADADLPAGRPYLAINMVASADGRAALNGSAIGIGSALDKRLLYELRAEADVVLHGASTVRADPLSARVPADLVAQREARGLQPQPWGAIVTRTGDLPTRHPYYDSTTLIYSLGTAPVTVAGPTIEVVRVTSVPEVVTDLGQRGARRILCEGGPTLNGTLFDAGLVDELFLTIAPKLFGGATPLTIVNGGSFGSVALELRNLVEVAGELYLRYGVRTPA
jgi:2,5-diamino-6-(ribosylamino)-4(3H)-pyrimidinone 5'-phosphate reductase